MDAWMIALRTAIRFHQEGDIEQAEQHYREVLESQPNQALALHSLGLIAYNQGEFDDAEEFVHQAISADPESAIQYNTMGVIYEALQQADKAINAYQQAIRRNRDYAEAYKNLAQAHKLQGCMEEALQNYQQAVRTAPQAVHILVEYGDTLRQVGRLAEATVQYHQALALQPEHPEIHNNLALCLKEQQRFDEAAAAMQRALELNSNSFTFLSNLAGIQQEQGHLDEALATCQKLMRFYPNQPESVYNFACVLRDLGRLDEAIHNNRRAIELRPDMAEAHWNLAVCYLLAGRFAEGWEKFGWRRRVGYLQSYPHNHMQPAWDGSPFEGQRLFIHCEQGLGDAIQFARFLPRVKERGGTVILGVWSPLRKLFHGLPGVDEWIEMDWHTCPAVEADLVTSLLDLPARLLITPDELGMTKPYLSADPERVTHWQGQLAQSKYKIGFVWAGSPHHVNDRQRSCDVSLVEPLTRVPRVQIYGLQKEVTHLQTLNTLDQLGIPNLGDQLDDLAETAAVIANLDLVISVDTGVLHLAAALGKPTWGLIPHNPDWRWQRDREDNPWYPQLRLFRQQEPGHWTEVFERVAVALREAIGS
jgi:tetratricopeptide (TPR) repeat protein